MRLSAAAALALLATACAAPPRPPPASTPPASTSPASTPPASTPPASTPPASTAQRVAQILADARGSEHEAAAALRAELAGDASRQAEACLALEPQAAACRYGDALALGLEARAHPAHAGEFLKRMLAALDAAEAADPLYDGAGPARVRALVLARAPGWPLGPGDPAAGVVAARRAVSLRPQYPPNLLALAEALARNGDAREGHEAYQRARDAALALPASSDREDWLREADQGLRR